RSAFHVHEGQRRRLRLLAHRLKALPKIALFRPPQARPGGMRPRLVVDTLSYTRAHGTRLARRPVAPKPGSTKHIVTLTRLLASFSLLIAVASRSPLEAQPLDRSGAGALTGTLVSADTVAVAVRTEEGSIVAFTVENPASVPAGLLPGTRVTVR